MLGNSYERPDFVDAYVAAETDANRNRYEWEITMAALGQFIEPGMRMIDYGCGSGVFTAIMADLAGPDGSCVGTDASAEMLRHASEYADKPGVVFEQWDACRGDSALEDGTADLVTAKLAFNYIAPDDLHRLVLPRLRACLKDTGLLVAVLPNPFKEAGYDLATYSGMEQVAIEIGGFGGQLKATAHHHRIEALLQASYSAGFAFAGVLALPELRFDPSRQSINFEMLNLPLADDIPDSLLDNKRLLYVFGAGLPSYNTFTKAFERLNDWLFQTFSN